MQNFSYKYDNLNNLKHFRKCTQKYNRYINIVHFFSENFWG